MKNDHQYQKILITGGCGFIGSNFIHYYLKEHSDTKIVNLDALTYAGNPENLTSLTGDDRYTFIKGDIRDTELMKKVLDDVDAVIHFAAESHVDRSINGAGAFIQTNVYGTYTLLEAAYRKLSKGRTLKKFVMISTDEVYGDIPKGRTSKEDDPLLPRNPYAASKAGADRLAYSYQQTHQLPVVITRSSNNFGPYQYPEKMLPLFVTNLIEGKKVPLYGDGKNIRDWLFVEDNCRGIDTVLHKGRNGEVYNIGGGNEKQNVEVTRMILELMGKDETSIDFVKDRKGHDRRYSLDCTKIESELGWKPIHNFKEAFQNTISWYQDNEKWWRDLK